MPDIFHDFWIKAPSARVFDAISTPQGLDQWWTKKSKGEPSIVPRLTLHESCRHC